MPEQDPWPHLQRRAASHLRSNLADRVLRRHRLSHVAPREAWQSLGFALLTASACAVLVTVVGTRFTSDENARNYAAWCEVATQTSLVAPRP